MRLFLALTLALALALPAAPVWAQDAPAAAEPAPICTTTTVVVRQGDVVLSTDTKTKCAKPGEAASGLDIDGGAIGGALGGLLSAPKFDVGAAGGEWRTVQQGSVRVCVLRMLRKPGPKGRGVQTQGCVGSLASARTWTLEDGAAVLYSDSGAPIVRLSGDHIQLAGRLDDGTQIVLKR